MLCSLSLLSFFESNLKIITTTTKRVASVIFKKNKKNYAKPLLGSCHWLPVKKRIDYKICTIVFKCLNNSEAQYLHFTRDLKSLNDKTLLFIPRSNLKQYGDRSFKYYSPHVWKLLPREIRDSDCLEHFKKDLKCHLFKIAFDL